MISQASISKTSANGCRQSLRCQRDNLAILMNRFGTRVVSIVGRAADIYYDWNVEVRGSPIWAIDARSDAPAFTNLGFVMEAQLFPSRKQATSNWRLRERIMSSQASKRPDPSHVRVIAQNAMRSVVLASTEREAFDTLAEALRKISDLAGVSSHA